MTPFLRIATAGLALSILTACAGTPTPGGSPVNDPAEGVNRAVHGFNRGLDAVVLRPASKAYVAVLPRPVQSGIGNLADTLAQPGYMANHLLQGKFDKAALNLTRFSVIATFGLVGLLDTAGAMGIDEETTDFGETLHIWGAGEGAYVELPVFGPSTVRDAVGRVVDLGTNPLKNALPPAEREISTAISVAERLGKRGRFGNTIDSVLYDSADSYAQSRLIYLQNRRFELGADASLGYTDPYKDAATADPYEDPYAE